MTATSTIVRWLEHLAQGELTTAFEVDDEPELQAVAEALGRVQTRWRSERQQAFEHMVSHVDQAVALEAREREHREAQAEMSARLGHADRMVAMGRLASGIAHEINNPLTLILGNLEALSDFITNPQVVPASHRGALAEIVDEIDDGAERIRRVVQDLRQFSRTGRPDERTTVDLVSAIKTSIRVVRNQLRHRARVLTDFEAHAYAVGEEAQLQQVFVNLLLNAVQAMSPDSPRAPQVVLTIRALSDDEVAVRISDNGVGISSHNLERIFDPFFTTRDVGEGSGLGLSVSAELVRSMGGRLEVQSTEGRGSTFTIVLPRAPSPVVRPAEAPVETAAQDRNSRARASRILIVDDEPGIVKMVGLMLRDHDVTTAVHGSEALERLRRETFDVVICDLMVPDLSGMQLYETIKAEAPALAERFVFMTAGAFYPDAIAFLARGERPCIHKPFDRARLLEALKPLLGAEPIVDEREPEA